MVMLMPIDDNERDQSVMLEFASIRRVLAVKFLASWSYRILAIPLFAIDTSICFQNSLINLTYALIILNSWVSLEAARS